MCCVWRTLLAVGTAEVNIKIQIRIRNPPHKKPDRQPLSKNFRFSVIKKKRTDIQCEVKGIFHPITGHEGPEGE